MVTNGVRLHYVDWGGNGEPVLLLPGLFGTAEIYSDFAPRLTDRFRVLALTLRGHGQSDEPKTGYEPDSLVEDIRAFLDSMRIGRAHLVGHSLSGAELTAFAGRYPERVLKLVYLDAAYDWVEVIVGFDDYYCYSANRVSGERAALHEFLEANPQWNFCRFKDIHWCGLAFVVEDASELPSREGGRVAI